MTECRKLDTEAEVERELQGSRERSDLASRDDQSSHKEPRGIPEAMPDASGVR